MGFKVLEVRKINVADYDEEIVQKKDLAYEVLFETTDWKRNVTDMVTVDNKGRVTTPTGELFQGEHVDSSDKEAAIDFVELYMAKKLAASALGKAGGSVTSSAKKKSSAKNGQKGGRPKKGPAL